MAQRDAISTACHAGSELSGGWLGIGCANYSVYRSIGTPNVVLGGGGGGVWLGGAVCMGYAIPTEKRCSYW